MDDRLKPFPQLKKGDELKVVWTDGYELTGTFVGTERGFIIIQASDGKKVPCIPEHLDSIVVIT